MSEEKREWVQIDFRSSITKRTIRFDNLTKAQVMVSMARCVCSVQGEVEFDASMARMLSDAELLLAEAKNKEEQARAMSAAAIEWERRANSAEAALASRRSAEAELIDLRRQVQSLTSELANTRSGQRNYPNIRQAPVLPTTPSRPTEGRIQEIIDAVTRSGSNVKPASGSGYKDLEID